MAGLGENLSPRIFCLSFVSLEVLLYVCNIEVYFNNSETMNNLIKTDKEYQQWLIELKQRIRQSQIKAALRVNTELLELYWSIGSDIVRKQSISNWGDSVIEQLSADLRIAFPEMKGFSARNLWYMKKWFLFYSGNEIKLHQLGAEFQQQKLPQLVAEIPWRHHTEIITKCKSVDEALFYLRKTKQEGWSRAILIHFIEIDLFHAQGKSISNFSSTLPPLQSELAQETLKDPYNFDFLMLTDGYKEKELEKALTDNLTRFLLELGTGFAFAGHQVPIQVGKSTYYIDMLFYHFRMKCFIVVELKTVKFEPEFAGKLNFYVTAVDRQLRRQDDNPTIGLLICKDKEDVVAEYTLADIHKPLGVSAYDLRNILPEEFKSSLPTIEEIERNMKD